MGGSVLVKDRTKLSSGVRLKLSVLGGFKLEFSSGGPVSIVHRKASGLLAYLALNPNRSETRERLAGLLWSDRGEEQARASLRQTLKQLRVIFDEIEFDGFVTERQHVSLSFDRLAVDLHEIAKTLDSDTVPTDLIDCDSVPEKILYGFETLGQSFSAWLHVVRQNWQDRFVDQLRALLRTRTHSSAKPAAEALIAIDPTDEEAHRCLIRHHADNRNTPASLKQYKILWDLLDEEYDMEPDEETQSLIADIKAGNYVAEGSPLNGWLAVPKRQTSDVTIDCNQYRLPVIGVWNFVSATAEGSGDYLVDGFRRELLAALIRFREWITVEGTDFDTLVSEETPAPKPDYRLEGVYVKDGDNIRLIITLKEIATHAYFWSEQIDLELENWFATQRLIVRRIAIAFNVHLSAKRLQQISDRNERELEVYDRWLQGQALTFQMEAKNWQRASSIFQGIIEENEDFPLAYSSLAQLENSVHFAFPGRLRTQSSHANALQFARRAVELDPLDTKSHLCLAWAYALTGLHDRAELSFDLACDLNQNDPWTLVSAALGWAFSGNTEKSLQLADQALSLNLEPSKVHWCYQAAVRFVCGDYEGCVHAAEKAGEVIANLQGWKVAALAQMGELEEAEHAAAGFVAEMRKRWVQTEAPSNEDIAAWFLHCFPIRDRETWKKLCNGLVAAGVEVADQDRPRPPV